MRRTRASSASLEVSLDAFGAFLEDHVTVRINIENALPALPPSLSRVLLDATDTLSTITDGQDQTTWSLFDDSVLRFRIQVG